MRTEASYGVEPEIEIRPRRYKKGERSTHCLKGHAKTGQNLHIDAQGYYGCKICIKSGAEQRKLKRKTKFKGAV